MPSSSRRHFGAVSRKIRAPRPFAVLQRSGEGTVMPGKFPQTKFLAECIPGVTNGIEYALFAASRAAVIGYALEHRGGSTQRNRSLVIGKRCGGPEYRDYGSRTGCRAAVAPSTAHGHRNACQAGDRVADFFGRDTRNTAISHCRQDYRCCEDVVFTAVWLK